MGRRQRRAARGRRLTVELAARQPFDASGLLHFLSRRAVAGVEQVEGDVYRRSLRLARGAGVADVRLTSHGAIASLELEDGRDTDEALAGLRLLLDLDADSEAVDSVLAADPLLKPMVAACPGRRVPGHTDPQELAIRAVLGQQVSVAAATTLAGRLTVEHGVALRSPVGGVTHAFPTVEALARLDPGQLPMPRSRGRTIVGLAAAVAAGDIDLAAPDARERLLDLAGIGPWTADYIAMRALGDRDVFLETDLAAGQALRGLGADPDPERWRPFRSYALMHLWASLS